MLEELQKLRDEHIEWSIQCLGIEHLGVVLADLLKSPECAFASGVGLGVQHLTKLREQLWPLGKIS